MPPNHHVIRKQFIELNLSSSVNGDGWLERISSIHNNRLIPEFEKLFDRYTGVDEWILLDKLEVDVGHLDTGV